MSDREEFETKARELYQLPVDQFTQARDALVKQLRSDGRKEEATSASKLRKPTVVAWALNQVAARNAKQLEWLIEAEERVRRALEKGGGPAEVREATSARHDLIAQIVDAAEKHLQRGGHSSAAGLREKIARSLYGIASDPSVKESILSGTLSKEPEPQEEGFNFAIPERAQTDRPDPKLEKRAADLREKIAELEMLSKESDTLAATASREAERAQAEADRLARTALAAEGEASANRRKLEELRAELAELEGT